jgi:hypothetical protein
MRVLRRILEKCRVRFPILFKGAVRTLDFLTRASDATTPWTVAFGSGTYMTHRY